MPLRVLPPRFNRYEGGGTYGNHVDNAVRTHPPTARHLRTDLSFTLFLNDPDDYDGGELVIEDGLRGTRVKLPAAQRRRMRRAYVRLVRAQRRVLHHAA